MKIVLRMAIVPFTAATPAFAENIIFPPGSGVIDVKAQYGAKGDGVTDDTAAIQRALTDEKSLIYLPNGTYLVSDTLRWGGKQKRQVLQGQSTDGTIIRLKDRAAGYQQADKPLAVIWTGRLPAQRFRNGIRNLTVDTGAGNAGAIGVQFIANNQGGMSDVSIRSGDGGGIIGLDLGYTDEQGPCLIAGVKVTGFDIGIHTKHAVDSVTFEHITVENQKRFGFVNEGQCISMRGFISTNNVPAFYNQRGPGVVTLLDAKLSGSGEAAILNEATLYARNVAVRGCKLAIQNNTGTKENAAGPMVAEFVSRKVLSLFPSPGGALNLPVKETPDVPWDGPAMKSLLSLLAVVALFPAAHAAENPNVLFIMADDYRPELASYGSAAVTPNLDRLARRSVQFERAYSQQAVCNPSRSSMLTGLRPATLGLYVNGTHFCELKPAVITLPQWFKQHGYVTRDVGKDAVASFTIGQISFDSKRVYHVVIRENAQGETKGLTVKTPSPLDSRRS